MFEGRLCIQDVQKRGHWGSFASVTRYEKHAKLLKVLGTMTALQKTRATASAKGLSKLMMSKV